MDSPCGAIEGRLTLLGADGNRAFTLEIDDFLAHARERQVIDVRTPSEFAKGHIPGAVNMPLLSDVERAEVGTAYVQKGRQTAVSIGLAGVGSRLEKLAENLLEQASGSPRGLLIHCWRGGMRSGSVAWLASLLELPTATLQGGYKAFRRRVREEFEQPRKFYVVAGFTGTGKTEILHALKRQGAQILDLESLACHKGSVFGDLGEPAQPRQEQFENNLAMALIALDPQRPVWVEDESRKTGTRWLPPSLWATKQAGQFAIVQLPRAERVNRLGQDYAGFPAGDLIPRVESLHKRLGGDRTRAICRHICEGHLPEACEMLLDYYDKFYQRGLDLIPAAQRREYPFDRLDPEAIAEALLADPPSVSKP